jgi:hypothetical protein
VSRPIGLLRNNLCAESCMDGSAASSAFGFEKAAGKVDG